MITDETIYQQYLRGETNAADLLVEKYADMLIFYINGYIKDVHEVEDLMIEAFSQIFAKERPITGEGSFKSSACAATNARSGSDSRKKPAILPCGIAKNTATSSCGLMTWILNCQIKPWLRPGPFKMSGIVSSMRHWIN